MLPVLDDVLVLEPLSAEPLRWGVVQLTRDRLAAADRRAGRRGAWLRLLDRLGLGLDS